MNTFQFLIANPLLIPVGIFAGWMLGEMLSDVLDGNA